MSVKRFLYARYCVEFATSAFLSFSRCPVASLWTATRISWWFVVVSFPWCASPWPVVFVALQNATFLPLFCVGYTLSGDTIEKYWRGVRKEVNTDSEDPMADDTIMCLGTVIAIAEKLATRIRNSCGDRTSIKSWATNVLRWDPLNILARWCHVRRL